MNTRIALAVIIGAVVGGAAVQGLHAQTGKKAYLISEFKDVSWNTADTRKRMADTGGKSLQTVNGKVTAIDGTAPAHVGIIEWPNADAAANFAKSKDTPQAERRYVVEVE